MKAFFLIFLLLPLAGCAYVGWHVWHILPLNNWWRGGIVALLLAAFFLLFFNFIVGLDDLPLTFARVLYKIGTSSIFILLYLVMLFLLLDAGRLFHLVPSSFLHDSWKGTLTVLSIIVALFVYGNINYHHKVCQSIAQSADTPLRQPMNIMLLSDLHLGYHNTRADLKKWVDLINSKHPDVVLIAGDIVDKSLRPLLEENMAEELQRLTMPVYACPGNHDYYADIDSSSDFFRQANICLLRDSAIVLNDEVVIIGRDDRINDQRATVAQLVDKAPKGKFTLLLDHQPYHLEEAESAGIDFQFSGHTHYGQVWPISWIEDLLYENAYGPSQKGSTHYYVTSGLGIWGGKFRIGTRSEYVMLTLK